LIHLARKSIDQETTASILPSISRSVLGHGSFHGILKKFDGDFHWDNGALSYARLDQGSKLGTHTMLLCPKQVTS
jgi:hypothetical protein